MHTPGPYYGSGDGREVWKSASLIISEGRDVERGSFYHHPSSKPFPCTCEHCGTEYWVLGTGADGFAVDALQCPHCERTTEVGHRG